MLFSTAPQKKIEILICWIAFSTFYWIAAYNKPFHIDEFSSWVYSEKCSFEQIITLHDSGIGHPPLFHLIQKSVQTLFPFYNPILVRLANYVFGSFFIILIVIYFRRYRNFFPFLFGISSSAGLVGAFVFSRMWGIVLMNSLILLMVGERYIQQRKLKYLILLIVIWVIGFLSDYSFIVLIPFIIITLYSSKKYFTKFITIAMIFIFIVFLLSTYWAMNNGNNNQFIIYSTLSNILKIVFSFGNLILNYSFFEPFFFAISLIIISVLFFKHDGMKNILYQKNLNFSERIFLLTLFLILFEILNTLEILRIRYIFLFMLLFFIFLFHREKFKIQFSNDNTRYIFTIILGLLIILAINPIFWNNLLIPRFCIIFLPFAFLLIYKNFRIVTLYVISILLIFSGIIYSWSSFLDIYYPPPQIDINREMPLIFESSRAYSNQYLRTYFNRPIEPYILNLSSFDKDCRICKIGTDEIPYDQLKQFLFIGHDDLCDIPEGFIMVGIIKNNLKFIDCFQFKYFHTCYPYFFNIYDYRKSE